MKTDFETLTRIPAFVRVAETSSFSEAARQLGISASGVSKAISRLEESLEVRLFTRTTRKVALTEDGASFYERCRVVLADLEEAQTELREARAEPRGTLLVSLPVALGKLHVVPALPELLDRHPELSVRVELTDRRVDIIGEGLDAAVRIGAAATERGRLVTREIGRSRAVVCASPEYLERIGTPRSPPDLARHNVYIFGPLGGTATRRWTFEKGERSHAVTVTGNVSVDNAEALVDLARAGKGIIGVFDFIAAPAVKRGELRLLFSSWQQTAGVPISIVYPRHRQLSAKVQAFADFTADVVARSTR